jgi:hypothetical protein
VYLPRFGVAAGAERKPRWPAREPGRPDRGRPFHPLGLLTYHPVDAAASGNHAPNGRNLSIYRPVKLRGYEAAWATKAGRLEVLTGSRTPGTGYHGCTRNAGRPATTREGALRQGHARAADRFSKARPMYRSHDRECPRCGGPAYRVKRRKIDRLISLLFPRRRFRCSSMGCGWEGNLPVKPSPAPLARKR